MIAQGKDASRNADSVGIDATVRCVFFGADSDDVCRVF